MREILEVFTPSVRDVFFAALAFAIPFTLSKSMEKVLKAGNPPWKQEEGDK
ncbi:hypothetical protein JOC85_003798 [Bacillus mesophilus]|uniref:Uncharacterized protein n=1 Tax=Bacillus mesophilus TaxID=1808955 RepID=A0A6M0QBJ3_9BACI|nr:hypothetical protein [Bacillus mesophilus]MBM7662972.1 hypothetical protein [Bacillus mesophilus]NEY73702.1 hypothetical protein [Bacillus mesophilus]